MAKKSSKDIILEGIHLVLQCNSAMEAIELQGQNVVSDIIIAKIQEGKGWDFLKDVLKSDAIMGDTIDTTSSEPITVNVIYTEKPSE